MLGPLSGGSPVPAKIASAAKKRLEFITQRTKRVTIQEHQAESPTAAALKKTRKKKNVAATHWACDLSLLAGCLWGWMACGQRIHIFLLPKAKKTQTEEYQVRSSIRLIINEIFIGEQ